MLYLALFLGCLLYVRCWWTSHEDKGVGSVNCINCFISCFVVVFPVDVRLCGHGLRWLQWQVFLVSWAVQVSSTQYSFSFVARLWCCMCFIALLWREKLKEGERSWAKHLTNKDRSWSRSDPRSYPVVGRALATSADVLYKQISFWMIQAPSPE